MAGLVLFEVMSLYFLVAFHLLIIPRTSILFLSITLVNSLVTNFCYLLTKLSILVTVRSLVISSLLNCTGLYVGICLSLVTISSELGLKLMQYIGSVVIILHLCTSCTDFGVGHSGTPMTD